MRARSGRLPGTFWYLWSGLLINRVGGFGIIFLSLYLVKERGLDSTGAGLVTGCYGIGGCGGVLAAGVLADRWGRRKTLLVSHAGTTAALLGLAFAPWVPMIAVFTTLVGATQMMVGPPLVAAMVDVVAPQDRSRAFSLEFWALNLGTMIAAPLAGLLAGAGFTPLFLVEAAATAVTLTILALKVPETLPPRTEEDDTAGLHTVLTDRVWMTFIGLTFVLAIIGQMTTTILPLAMAQDHFRPSAYGLVTGAAGLMIVAGQLLMPRLVGHRPDTLVLTVANLFLAAGIALIGGSDVLPMYFLAMGVLTIGQMLGAMANATTISDLSTPRLRARYQAVFYLSMPLAGFVAPALGGWSLQRLGAWTWPIFGALGALAALGHLVAAPARQRRVAALRKAAESATLSLKSCA